ncbi:MAG: single-stranded-DNA-specific exonuclease [Lentimonas sp.]|jgi:single-stranded-DNA-specific exonuclease
MDINWLHKKRADQAEIKQLGEDIKIDSILSEILIQRGIKTVEEAKTFFNPSLDDLHDPFLMKNLKSAAKRLEKAILNKQKIRLLGDYDVDGTTSVALLYTYLKDLTDNLSFYVPDRYEEGYGVSQKSVELAVEDGVELFITIDCGTKNSLELNWLSNRGCDVIVCDHHEPGDELPNGILLNPKQVDCEYPFKDLCGCGVGYKLLEGYEKLIKKENSTLTSLLDYVAIAIGADIVSVMGENRILTHFGMQILKDKPRPCFVSLLNSAGKTGDITLTDVVFGIAPRINAAGRIRVASDAVKLMISEDDKEITSLALQIEAHNSERKSLDSGITIEALQQILDNEEYANQSSTVVFHDSWSKGVVGIVASRLIEQHFRPTIVLTEQEGLLTGSARTVNDFDIHSALVTCEDLLEKFGGHQHAAGMTLKKENFKAFQKRFDQYVREHILEEDKSPKLIVDLEIKMTDIFKPGESLAILPRLKRILDRMEPFGPNNMKPVFLLRGVCASSVRILKGAHLKLEILHPDYPQVKIPAIGFGHADKEDLVASGMEFDLAFTLEANHWKNRTTLQLSIKDIKEAQ